MIKRDRLQVFAGNASRNLSENICARLGIGLGSVEATQFPDGEINIKINDDVRGSDVFIVQSTCPPVNDNLIELLILIDCVKRASAERVTAVIPYFGYARQDRKAEGRVPITAKLVANLLTASGVDRILTVDLHASQIQGFFDIPLDHLYAAPVLIDYLHRERIANPVIVAPDVGSIKMARGYAKKLNAHLAIVDKRRAGPQETEVTHIIGDIKGKNVIMVDDMISTGTTVSQAAKALKSRGAKDVYLCATHPLFCGGAVRKLEKAKIKKVIVTDTIPPQAKSRKKTVQVLSIAGLLSEAIRRIHNSESVSSLFF
ncbi:ribose-phosphate diphosphokinase [Planctomycetota bacterium]